MRSNAGMANTGGRRLALRASLCPPVITLAWLGLAWLGVVVISSTCLGSKLNR
jgi:hypothetical protein